MSENKFFNLRFDISFCDESITIYLEDNGCYVNKEMEDTYFLTEYYEDVFWNISLYDEDNFLSLIENFCNHIDYKMRDMLPDFEEFDDYKEIEGYWKCMGLLRDISKKPLLDLWISEKQSQIEICKTILEKISICNNNFSSDEIKLIEYAISDELSSLQKKIQGNI